MTSGKTFLEHKSTTPKQKNWSLQHAETKNYCSCEDTTELSVKMSHKLGAASERDRDLKAPRGREQRQDDT